MSKTKALNLTHHELRQRLDYDPVSGTFTRKGGKAISLKPNGTGYLRISINGVSFKAHRLAWLWSYGVLPDFDIDHINGNKTDNRLANLRVATRSQNKQNVGVRRGTGTGVKGVYLHTYSKPDKPIYVARIKYDGKQRHLGCFGTLEEAEKAYRHAELAYFGEFAHRK